MAFGAGTGHNGATEPRERVGEDEPTHDTSPSVGRLLAGSLTHRTPTPARTRARHCPSQDATGVSGAPGQASNQGAACCPSRATGRFSLKWRKWQCAGQPLYHFYAQGRFFGRREVARHAHTHTHTPQTHTRAMTSPAQSHSANNPATPRQTTHLRTHPHTTTLDTTFGSARKCLIFLPFSESPSGRLAHALSVW